jgi:hypothetical protein
MNWHVCTLIGFEMKGKREDLAARLTMAGYTYTMPVDGLQDLQGNRMFIRVLRWKDDGSFAGIIYETSPKEGE